MKQDISKLLQKKKKNILEDWMNLQLADAGLREDLMSNDELREQSAELLDALLKGVTEKTWLISIQMTSTSYMKFFPAFPSPAPGRDFRP